MVNASEDGNLVWLDFDGVYKNSDMWLNGAYLGHFFSGYVSFRYWLHNATFENSTTPVLNYGAPNVLSVLVDALTEQEGWFYVRRRVVPPRPPPPFTPPPPHTHKHHHHRHHRREVASRGTCG